MIEMKFSIEIFILKSLLLISKDALYLLSIFSYANIVAVRYNYERIVPRRTFIIFWFERNGKNEGILMSSMVWLKDNK